MAAAKKKAVAVKQSQELANVPAYIKQGGNRGSENVTNEDLQLPRLNVLQALSPQIDSDSEVYIEGAKQGMLFNTLTGELYPDGIIFTPITFQKRWFVWKDQNEGGGLQGIYDFKDQGSADSKAEEDESFENVLFHEHLVLLPNGDEVILSCSKSKMKVSKKFNSLIRLNGGDRFGRNYLLTSVKDENSNNQKYYNFSIAPATGRQAWPSQERYEQAEALYAQVMAGTSYGGDYTEGDVLDTNPDY